MYTINNISTGAVFKLPLDIESLSDNAIWEVSCAVILMNTVFKHVWKQTDIELWIWQEK